MTSSTTTVVAVRIPHDLRESIQKIATSTKTTVSEVVRVALETYVEDQ
jgi:predicted transcriptional regulator